MYWRLYNTKSKSDWLINTLSRALQTGWLLNTKSRVLQADWVISEINEKATLNIDVHYYNSYLPVTVT